MNNPQFVNHNKGASREEIESRLKRLWLIRGAEDERVGRLGGLDKDKEKSFSLSFPIESGLLLPLAHAEVKYAELLQPVTVDISGLGNIDSYKTLKPAVIEVETITPREKTGAFYPIRIGKKLICILIDYQCLPVKTGKSRAVSFKRRIIIPSYHAWNPGTDSWVSVPDSHYLVKKRESQVDVFSKLQSMASRV